ncbi:MAG: hypothetical protein K9J25_13200 [Bacteroidales bacterium]|nr:hypothetical protein [Bacteroidales bacterium]
MGTNNTHSSIIQGLVFLTIAGTATGYPSLDTITSIEPTKNIEFSLMYESDNINNEESVESIIDKKLNEKEQLEVLIEFSQKIITESENIDKDIVKIVDDHFWELF